MTGEASDNPFQFTGRENDGTGLYYYRARYYSPAMKRFISEDPLGYAAGDVNFYRYVGGNPVKFIDPSGLDYLDLNISGGGRGIGLTFGLMFSDNGDIYPYFGVGFMTPGASVSITTSEDDPTLGINVGVQGALGIAMQKGYSITGKDYSEKGIGYPGFSITSYKVLRPFNFTHKTNTPIGLAKCH